MMPTTRRECPRAYHGPAAGMRLRQEISHFQASHKFCVMSHSSCHIVAEPSKCDFITCLNAFDAENN